MVLGQVLNVTFSHRIFGTLACTTILSMKCSELLYELDGDREEPKCSNVLEQDEDVLSKNGCEIFKCIPRAIPEGSLSL